MRPSESFAEWTETESSLDDLYERAPCGYLSTTIEGTIVRVNDTLLRWTGHQRTDLIGLSFVTLLTSGSRLLFETRYLAVLHLRGEAREVALSVRTANGEVLPILINGVVVTDEHGRPRAIRTAVFDASKRQEYERALLSAQRRAEASEVRVRLLQSASSTFSAATTENAVAERLAVSMREAFAASNVSVYLADERGTLHLAAGRPALGLQNLFDGGTAEVLVPASGVAVISRTDTRAHSSGLAEVMRRARVETLTTVALSDGSSLLGVSISSFLRSRTFELQDSELFGALALQAAHVLTRIRLQQELEQLALYDPLTGLASRHLVQRLLTEILHVTRVHGDSVALLFIDLDGFKAINDRLGHSSGDGVLREIAARLSSAVRAGDDVGRLGGDEFVVICRNVRPEDTDTLVHRLLTVVAQPLSGRASGTRVTCSIGVAVYSGGEPLPPDLLIARADAAMYQSKAAGKNQSTTVTAHGTGSLESVPAAGDGAGPARSWQPRA